MNCKLSPIGMEFISEHLEINVEHQSANADFYSRIN